MGRTFEQGHEKFARVDPTKDTVVYCTFEELWEYYQAIENVERKASAIEQFKQILSISDMIFGIVDHEVVIRI